MALALTLEEKGGAHSSEVWIRNAQAERSHTVELTLPSAAEDGQVLRVRRGMWRQRRAAALERRSSKLLLQDLSKQGLNRRMKSPAAMGGQSRSRTGTDSLL